MARTADDTFSDLIEEHKGILYKVANAYCQDETDRQDVIQEIIIQLWHSLDRYDQRYQRSTWVYRIALNVAISFYRREKKRKESATTLTDNILEVVDPSGQEQQNENIQWLHRFISQLPELERALMLLYLDEKSYTEIAEIVGITQTNVATKISRIKQKLKKQFLTLNAL